MGKKSAKVVYFFVDESGDPTFYDRKGSLIIGEEGCSIILILGFIKTEDPKKLRREIEDQRKKFLADPYLKGIPSLRKTSVSFHAKDDCPEVRQAVFKLLPKLDFKAEIYVARKVEKVFKSKYRSKEELFYDDLISKLFENHLHQGERVFIYFSKRGLKPRQRPLEQAIFKAKYKFQQKYKKKIKSEVFVQAQSPEGEPCLQIIDYINWAIFRAYTKKEMRFLETVKEKISLIVDVFDFKKYPKNYYTKRNSFSLEKISPL